jgi:hypothetical protein
MLAIGCVQYNEEEVSQEQYIYLSSTQEGAIR